MRILIVDDTPRTGEYLKRGLTECGFAVDVARSGPDGLHMALENDYELMILDVPLPGMDGWTVLQRLREQKATPAMFLTACDEIADRVRGLELGADDYLAKPFAFAELLARVRTLLRRRPARKEDILVVADLRMDVIRHRVSRAGRPLMLTAKEYALLQLLARRQGEVLSRYFIASQVWDTNFHTNTNVVDVAIRRLRTKVDDPHTARLIHTVRGMGYVMEDRRGCEGLVRSQDRRQAEGATLPRLFQTVRPMAATRPPAPHRHAPPEC